MLEKKSSEKLLVEKILFFNNIIKRVLMHLYENINCILSHNIEGGKPR